MSNQFTHGYALLIGVDENNVKAWALPDVAKDIAALGAVLAHPERCAYPAGNVKTITGVAATRQGILDGLAWLQECVQADAGGDTTAGSNATALVYYTGHGWVDTAAQPNEFFFIPCDIKENTLKSRALRAADFAETVNGIQPRRLLVVLDCCHAGGMGVKDVAALPASLPPGYAAKAFAPAALMVGEKAVASPSAKGLEALAQGAGRAVLSSSQGAQSSYLRRDGKMSIFTYHLIEALTGHAQPQEGAKEVLVSDVMGHVWRRVPSSARVDWGVEQTPDYQVSGNFPVALLLGGKGLSKGQPAPDPLEPVAGPASPGINVNITSGGSTVIGDVTIGDGGTFIGRSQKRRGKG